jgi:membrane-associated protease RseP (regulator of RpoE activity)
VITAVDGEQGLELAVREKPDAILLDLLMPRRPGIEVLRALKAETSTAAIPVLIYGVSQSFVLSPGRLQDVVTIPDPLLIRWLIELVLRPPADMVVLGHPVLFAGWIGLIVTSINLLPAGMLDGGHAVRAAFGPRVHAALSYAGAGLAVVMGFYPMAILIILLMRRGHVGPLDDLSPLSPSRRAVGLALVVIFVLSAVVFPSPFTR